VFIYHLVAPATREGRVQEVLLQNLDAAAKALDGRVFDLMDATAARAGFDFAAALVDAYRGLDATPRVPSTETLVQQARELAAEEDALRTPTDLSEAQARFAVDRLEAVNPVMVEGFLRNIAAAANWEVGPGPAVRILTISAARPLPSALGGETSRLVSVDGEATAAARTAGAELGPIVTIGPTEEAFRQLLNFCSERCDSELYRGAPVTDQASTTPYSLFVFATELQSYDGVAKTSRPNPFLIRYSGSNAFPVDWTAVSNLRSAKGTAARPAPGSRVAADEVAETYVAEQQAKSTQEQVSWVRHAREDLDSLRARWQRQLRGLPEEQRVPARERFEEDRRRRLEDLARAEVVTASPPQLIGWLEVRPGANVAEIGYDPDSELPAIELVTARLVGEGFDVDDRQTAGLGYDLFAQHRTTREQRLIEVKGQLGSLGSVTLESNEWAQAMQRGAEYWLYVVTHCGEDPTLSVVIADPAGVLSGGPRLIERFQIPVSQLRRFAGDES
jgi:hypothetical protein